MTCYQGRLLFLLFFSYFGMVHCEDTSWCYECNTELEKERTQECNDPYLGRPGDLSQCPQSESQQCLKSTISYKSRHTTVRACVPSSQIDTYCDFKDFFPEAKIECHFCSGNACNSSSSPDISIFIIVSTISLVILRTSCL